MALDTFDEDYLVYLLRIKIPVVFFMFDGLCLVVVEKIRLLLNASMVLSAHRINMIVSQLDNICCMFPIEHFATNDFTRHKTTYLFRLVQ